MILNINVPKMVPKNFKRDLRVAELYFLLESEQIEKVEMNSMINEGYKEYKSIVGEENCLERDLYRRYQGWYGRIKINDLINPVTGDGINEFELGYIAKIETRLKEVKEEIRKRGIEGNNIEACKLHVNLKIEEEKLRLQIEAIREYCTEYRKSRM